MPIKIVSSIAVLLLCLVSSVAAQTATVLAEIRLVSDIDSTMPGSPGDIYNRDDSIIAFSLGSNTATATNNLGTLDQAGIDGFHRTGDGCGDSIYSLDTATVIAGTAMRPSDVFTAAGNKVLDASATGIPDGINIDAISRDPETCDLLFSIDNIASLGGTAYKTDDIIRFNGSVFSLYQATNLNVNIDALHVLSAERLLISIDVGGSLPDVDTLDEEVLEINTGTTPFQLLSFAPSTFNLSWQTADINALWALPKPTEDFMFANGFEQN